MSADLALLVDDPSIIERAADPGVFLIEACERAKTWLTQALEHGDIDQIVELKSQADAIRVYTMSKQLGMDAELAATEIVRRAERGIGLAVRRGQEAGEIRRSERHGVHDINSISPKAFTGSGQTQSDIYAMTDDVSDEEFEEVLEEARAEKNLSRSGMARKLRRRKSGTAEPGDWIPEPEDRTASAGMQRRKLIQGWAEQGHSSRQMADYLGLSAERVRRNARESGIAIGADRIVGRTRAIDANRIIEETVGALEGMVTGIGLIDPEDIDPEQAANWAASIVISVRALNALIRTLRETAQ